MTNTEEKPDWWQENECLRADLGLPKYQPPRFEDGTYTHEVMEKIEKTYCCQLQFIGIDSRYPEDWEIRVDGEPVFAISRHRDEQGNTIYEMNARSFCKAIHKYIEGDHTV